MQHFTFEIQWQRTMKSSFNTTKEKKYMKEEKNRISSPEAWDLVGQCSRKMSKKNIYEKPSMKIIYRCILETATQTLILWLILGSLQQPERRRRRRKVLKLPFKDTENIIVPARWDGEEEKYMKKKIDTLSAGRGKKKKKKRNKIQPPRCCSNDSQSKSLFKDLWSVVATNDLREKKINRDS